MQAAVGVAQLDKLPDFIKARKNNWQQLRDGLADYEKFLVLPAATAGSEPSWFGFAVTVKEDAPFKRRELVSHLEARKIATRHIFGGNLVRQPAYQNIAMRRIGNLANSDRVMNDSFVVGVYPGLSHGAVEFILDSFKEFFAKY
jgi:CDP-6-deoxy-D-xylo-4-hexulose-3-dehydrase